jgi:4-amino-4-deoxy-L-arabinose transferase-like glycosyltransferase
MDTTAVLATCPELEERIESQPDQNWQLRSALQVSSFVAAIGLASAVWFFAHTGVVHAIDSPTYIEPAIGLASGRGFVTLAGSPETLRTPGFPLLIAAFLRGGAGMAALITFQHLLRIVVAVATAWATLRLTGSRLEAIAAGGILCLDLASLESAASILTENLFTTMMAGAVLCMYRAVDRPDSRAAVILSGLLAGATALVRPVNLFFAIAGAAFLLLARRDRTGGRAAVMFTIACASVPIAWTARNYVETGYATFSSISGVDMLHRAAGTLAIEERGSYQDNQAREYLRLEKQACLALSAAEPCATIAIEKRSAYFSRFSSSVIREHPVQYLKTVIAGAGAMMLGGDRGRLSELTGIPAASAMRILIGYGVTLLLLAGIGAAAWWRRNPRFFFLAAVVIGYLLFISAGAGSYSRMRVPIMPLYSMLIASGSVSLFGRFRFKWNDASSGKLEAS